MTRIGMDVKFKDGVTLIGATPLETLRAAHELGFEGLLVRTVDQAFPSLDAADIDDFAAEAARLGMFVQLGLGEVNPYMTAELPRVRDLGGGSYLAGMERMIALCARHGWTEAWTASGGFKPWYPAPYCFDRFRTDVPWSAQLTAIERFLERLAPILRRFGVRVNMETHEEITTFEIVRLIERIGEDVLGVCFDPANLPVRGERVDAGLGRVARYTHMTHLRDAILAPTGKHISRFLAPIGHGVFDWDTLLPTLLAAQPAIDLAIEGVGGTRAEMALDPGDPLWRDAHPDFSAADRAAIVALSRGFDARVRRGELPSVAELRHAQPARADYVEFLTESRDRLSALLRRHGNSTADTTASHATERR